MKRKFQEKSILIASNNPGKVKEIKELLSTLDLEILSLLDKKIIEPEETENSFVGNAILKARYYGNMFNIPALADDSGLSIRELDAFPGIYSARIAGENKEYRHAFNLIEQKLEEKNLKSSKAFFSCALALWWPDDHVEVFEGELHGNIEFPAVFDVYGFGYAPIFLPDGHELRYSQLNDEIRNKISHRSAAFQRMISQCF